MTEKGFHFDMNYYEPLTFFLKLIYSNENNFSSPKKLLP